MKTILYRCESAAARQRAEELGISYPGRKRLHMVHTDGVLLPGWLKAIRGESDYFWGEVQLEGKGT